MDPRFDKTVAYLRGQKLERRDDSPQQLADYLETEVRPQLEAYIADVCEEQPVPVASRRGPGRKEHVQ